MPKNIQCSMVSTLAILAAIGLGTPTLANTGQSQLDGIQATASPETAEQKSARTGDPQTEGSMSDTDAPSSEPGSVQFLTQAERGETRATKWIGTTIVNQDEVEIGDVGDLLISEQGGTEAVIADVGGFLGGDKKEVAIPISSIKIEQKQGGVLRLVVNLTQVELQAAPAYEEQDPAAAQQPEGTDPVQEQAELQQSDQPDQVQEQTEMQQSEELDLTEDQTELQQSEEPDQIEQQQPEAADPTQDQAALPEAGLSIGIDEGPQEVIASASQSMGVSAADLIGADLVGLNDEVLGEVDDVILGEDGRIRALIVSIGGFLGIGQKSVAIQFDPLDIRRDGDGIDVIVPATEEELYAAPEYQSFEEY
jgi:sporulation protein YlmC with PRC-barrel domain